MKLRLKESHNWLYYRGLLANKLCFHSQLETICRCERTQKKRTQNIQLLSIEQFQTRFNLKTTVFLLLLAWFVIFSIWTTLKNPLFGTALKFRPSLEDLAGVCFVEHSWGSSNQHMKRHANRKPC